MIFGRDQFFSIHMNRFKIPPPKTRPFIEPKQTVKTKVLNLSLNDYKQSSTPANQSKISKFSTKLPIIILIFAFFIIVFILCMSKIINFNMAEKCKNSFRNRFNNFYNNVKANNTNAKIRIESSESINYYPLQYLINTKLTTLIPKNKLSLIFDDIIASFFCTILVLLIIQPTNSNPIISLLFAIIFLFSDSFIKNSMRTMYNKQSSVNSSHDEQALSNSIEFLLSIILHLELALSIKMHLFSYENNCSIIFYIKYTQTS